MQIFLFLVIFGSAVLAHPQAPKTLTGTLVDLECYNEKKSDLGYLRSKHTTKCFQMPECLKSGFALLTEQDEIFTLDPRGNEVALGLVKRTRHTKPLKVSVKGVVNGKNVAVQTLALVR